MATIKLKPGGGLASRRRGDIRRTYQSMGLIISECSPLDVLFERVIILFIADHYRLLFWRFLAPFYNFTVCRRAIPDAFLPRYAPSYSVANRITHIDFTAMRLSRIAQRTGRYIPFAACAHCGAFVKCATKTYGVEKKSVLLIP